MSFALQKAIRHEDILWRNLQAFEKSGATRGIVQILGIIMKSKVSMPKLKPAGSQIQFSFEVDRHERLGFLWKTNEKGPFTCIEFAHYQPGLYVFWLEFQVVTQLSDGEAV